MDKSDGGFSFYSGQDGGYDIANPSVIKTWNFSNCIIVAENPNELTDRYSLVYVGKDSKFDEYIAIYTNIDKMLEDAEAMSKIVKSITHQDFDNMTDQADYSEEV